MVIKEFNIISVCKSKIHTLDHKGRFTGKVSWHQEISGAAKLKLIRTDENSLELVIEFHGVDSKIKGWMWGLECSVLTAVVENTTDVEFDTWQLFTDQPQLAETSLAQIHESLKAERRLTQKTQ